MADEDRAADPLAAAERIRGELPELLPDQPTAVAEQLDAMIRDARHAPAGEDREQAVDRILLLLSRWDATRGRLHQLLPPDAGFRTGYQPLPGDQLASYDRWICPTCTFAWAVLDVADPEAPPEHCPADGSALLYAPAGG
jgi:hypothetical protein